MAYFAWKGIDLTGTVKKGVTGARTVADLDAYLLQQDIALLSVKNKRRLSLVASVSLEQKNAFFKSLAELLDTGVRIPQALEIIARQTTGVFQEILFSVVEQVYNGVPLSTALGQLPHLFDPTMVQMIVIGERSGNLVAALTQLSVYVDLSIATKKKVRAALLVPLSTLLFFCVVTLIIFICIIPRLATIFTTTGQQLPKMTRILLAISTVMSSWLFLASVGSGIIAVFVCAKMFLQKSTVRCRAGGLLLRLPLIGPVYHLHAMTLFTQTMSLMIVQGAPMVVGLRLAADSMHNQAIRLRVHEMAQSVQYGSSLSQVLYAHHTLFDESLRAAVQVGEQSGRLGALLTKSAIVYHNRLQAKIDKLITLLQPTLMIFLGLLISALIFAVYMPVFNLSHVLSGI